MRNSASTFGLKYEKQYCIDTEANEQLSLCCVITMVTKSSIMQRGCQDQAVLVQSKYVNSGLSSIFVEMLSSFSLGNYSLANDDAPDSLLVHQLRSKWSCEGRLQTSSIADLLLEPSWNRWGAYSYRFGQVGSMPVRGYFPFVAVEDMKHHVSWECN